MAAHLAELEARGQQSASIPLVLIHDGGGTTFQYFLLGPFARQVFAIGNPYFHQGGMPDGGLPQLASEYAAAIREKIGHGEIILGGWSFGGLLSVEVARLLGEDDQIRVKGIIMIDSRCPWDSSYKSRGRVRPNYQETTTAAVKDRVNKCFDNARSMILAWDRPASFDAPPAIMIRAKDAMNIKNAPDGVHVMDESDVRLGWSAYPCLPFISVVTVPGDHFSMFAEDRLPSMTRMIKEACIVIGQYHVQD